MRPKHFILLLLIPFSEIKAIFYNVDMAVSGYLFSDHKRQLCLVIEDYCNIIIMGVVMGFFVFYKRDKISVQILLFLFILNALDFLHLGLYDMQGFIMLKLLLSYAIYYKVWKELKYSY